MKYFNSFYFQAVAFYLEANSGVLTVNLQGGVGPPPPQGRYRTLGANAFRVKIEDKKFEWTNLCLELKMQPLRMYKNRETYSGYISVTIPNYTKIETKLDY